METFQVQVAHAQGRTTSDREIDLEDLTLQIPTTITPSVTDFRLIKIEYEAQVRGFASKDSLMSDEVDGWIFFLAGYSPVSPQRRSVSVKTLAYQCLVPSLARVGAIAGL